VIAEELAAPALFRLARSSSVILPGNVLQEGQLASTGTWMDFYSRLQARVGETQYATTLIGQER